jgi:hypothetical protein
MFCTGLHRQPFLLYTEMGKVNKSITIDEDIAKAGEEQAVKERRSFSSFVEYLVDAYLKALKKPKSVGKK